MAGLAEETRELELLLRQINYLMNHYTRTYLSGRGLTIPRFWVLSSLAADKPITMGELQRRLFLAPATLTGLVDGLVEEKLVRRWRDNNDRRLVYLALTPAGEEFLAGILKYRSSVLEKALANQDGINLGQLNAFLRLLLTNLRYLCPHLRSS
ncbi:MarR family winged helix-turn-helix transcriptional regulator [Neomoorella mulderi]|uniref:DNA-binding transcriptional repressor MarR n=1 Tax=Moorella mulderi DSM 14980 TaxID=1122241 RepID=A0A151AXM6_9FIRM|nr:MarR family winged helix-turn-helix transcriptional regulator [Moorella mulderi]KYH32302.1 DNA-binding transcriptional repressor MarR [Moorella mulderi DSM 14980]